MRQDSFRSEVIDHQVLDRAAGRLKRQADGRRAIAGVGETLSVWDVSRGTRRLLQQGRHTYVQKVAFLNGGRRALTAGLQMCLWDLETSACVRMFGDEEEEFNDLALLDGGRLVISADWRKTLRVWDVETGECLRTLTGHTSWVTSVAVAPIDPPLILAGTEDGQVVFFRYHEDPRTV